MATLEDVYNYASNARESLWATAKQYGREPKIYLHWSAGKYETPFSDYHINILGDGTIYVHDTDFTRVVSGTYKRNSGSISIALCCAYGAGSKSLGNYPPTAKQIEMMAQVIWKVADALWLTINKTYVLTHGEAANNEDGIAPHKPYAWWNDGYGDGDTRGDLEYLGTAESPKYNPFATDGSRGGDVLRGKANWYKNQNKTTSEVTTTNTVGSKYFSESELRCHGSGCCSGGAEKVSSRLLELLDQLRENIGGALELSCAYRCPTHNAEVGGVTNSQHVQGTAADVLKPSWLSFGEFKWYVEQLPFDGIGLYESSEFIHVDVRNGGVGSKIYWEG